MTKVQKSKRERIRYQGQIEPAQQFAMSKQRASFIRIFIVNPFLVLGLV